MGSSADVERIAEALRISLSLLIRRLRQAQPPGDLTLPETAALKRLEIHGPMTLTELAKLEEISPQSMGATIAALQERGSVTRAPDPNDGRQAIVSLTKEGRRAMLDRRSARTQQLASVLASAFTEAERKRLMAAVPLIERLAQHL